MKRRAEGVYLERISQITAQTGNKTNLLNKRLRIMDAQSQSRCQTIL